MTCLLESLWSRIAAAELVPRPIGHTEAAEVWDALVVLRFVKKLGPGLVTGASDDDPSGIATYAVAGASFGYATLWTAVVTLPLMVAVQLVCARIGMVSGVGLTGTLRRHYPRLLLQATCVLLLVANVFNIGADLGGMADAVTILSGAPRLVPVLLIAAAIILFTVYASYAAFAKYVKWTTLTLFSYVLSALVATPDWRAGIYRAFVPDLQWSAKYLTTVVAILGTTISPYLFFWQASHEVEAEKALGRRTRSSRRGATSEELADARADVIVGMTFSNVVQFFIILATASTLYRAGIHDVETTRQAADALRPIAGDAAYLLFAAGLIGSGLLAIPVLAGSASFAIAELLGWRAGLDEPFRRARRFYVVFGAAIAVGTALVLFSASPIRMLFYSALLNGVAAPPLMALIMLVANNPRVMGKWRNPPALNVLGWTATALMAAASLGMLFAR
jgi:NRAMP (natural resistance-associated macrophage protein)-like metal ion transporter